MLKDKNFYVELRDGLPHLKEKHSNGYYSQIQMAMGLSQLKCCDFIVYSFKGMIIIRIPFSEIYFIKLTEKLNHFFKRMALPYIIKMNDKNLYSIMQQVNPYHPDLQQVVKTVINFDFQTSLWYFKKLMKAFIIFIKPILGTTKKCEN